MNLRALPWFPCLALPLAVVMLQHHGIAYWSTALDSGAWGFITSATLEVFNLWGWWEVERRAGIEWAGWWTAWEGTRWFLFAGITTALLIGAPLYDVVKPLFATQVTLEEIDRELNSLDGKRAGFQDLALLRPGWQARIDQVDARQAELLGRRLKLLAAGSGLDWQRRAQIVGHGLALVLAVAAVVAGIRQLAGVWRRGELIWKGEYDIDARAGHDRGDKVQPSVSGAGNAAYRAAGRPSVALGSVEGPGMVDSLARYAAAAVRGVGSRPSGRDAVRPQPDIFNVRAEQPARGYENPDALGGVETGGGAPNSGEWEAGAAGSDPPLGRVQSARIALGTAFPGLTAREIARQQKPDLETAISLLMNHEQRLENRDDAKRRGVARGVWPKVLSVGRLEQIEQLTARTIEARQAGNPTQGESHAGEADRAD